MRAPVVFLMLSGCVSVPPSEVRTRLSLVDGALSVGLPLRVRVELSNLGSGAIAYDAQGVGQAGSFSLVGPDGRPVPYISGSRQTFGSDTPLPPGASATVNELDLAELYLIDRPGTYRIRFTGGGLYVVDPDDTELDPFSLMAPASNELTVQLASGVLPERTDLARRLLEILPEGWELGVDYGTLPREDERIALMRHPTPYKVDSLRVTLVVSREQPEGSFDLLGAWRGRSAWLETPASARQEWQDAPARVQSALDIR